MHLQLCLFNFSLNCTYYMAQVASCEISCSDWMTSFTCRSVIFRIVPVRITGFASHFANELKTKRTLKNGKILLNLKPSFTIMKATLKPTVDNKVVSWRKHCDEKTANQWQRWNDILHKWNKSDSEWESQNFKIYVFYLSYLLYL